MVVKMVGQLAAPLSRWDGGMAQMICVVPWRGCGVEMELLVRGDGVGKWRRAAAVVMEMENGEGECGMWRWR